MRRLIVLLIAQITLCLVSISQDRVVQKFEETWNNYITVKREKEALEKELKRVFASAKHTESMDREQINNLYYRQDELLKKLKEKQIEYKSKVEEIRTLKDTITALRSNNQQLKGYVDSLSLALNELEISNQQLLKNNKNLEKLLYFKVKDLNIAEVENSYFSMFKLGYMKNGKVRFTQNAKGESVKVGLFKSLEYISVTGKVYTPKNVDTLIGEILIYVDDKLWQPIRCSFKPITRTSSYNTFEISLNEQLLAKAIKPNSFIRIAFIAEECYHKYEKKIKDFNEAYYSNPAVFVISSVKPDVNRLIMDFENIEESNTDIGKNEKLRITDSCNSYTQDVLISLSTNLPMYSGEFISFSINDEVISNSAMLIPFDMDKAYRYKLKEGANLIKVKILTTTSSAKDAKNCNIWVIVLTNDNSTRVFRKMVALQQDELFGLYINYHPKSF